MQIAHTAVRGAQAQQKISMTSFIQGATDFASEAKLFLQQQFRRSSGYDISKSSHCAEGAAEDIRGHSLLRYQMNELLNTHNLAIFASGALPGALRLPSIAQPTGIIIIPSYCTVTRQHNLRAQQRPNVHQKRVPRPNGRLSRVPPNKHRHQPRTTGEKIGKK